MIPSVYVYYDPIFCLKKNFNMPFPAMKTRIQSKVNHYTESIQNHPILGKK